MIALHQSNSVSDAKKEPIYRESFHEERQSLESMARKYTSSYCDVIRAKIILLVDEGLSNDVIASRPVGAHIVAILMSLHYDFSFFQYGSAAFLTVYLSRRVVHVSEFKDWKSEPISQKTSPTPVLARCTY